ncbi:D-2-hydroxyglutarate dehydrogenase, mitochondrial [Hyalella azteca]|uniref:D-2-hydroxyglutarate dehydrogenase, mitochondrial n=1 Tax=Hyalella azteca TaxID=294128 RepID=A0A8B7P9F8_HYAAZ|nr:D-2-hydroxyglutarate dehydrogenase, mitochondrial [Hyalella azteca]
MDKRWIRDGQVMDKRWTRDGQEMDKRWTRDGQEMDKRWTSGNTGLVGGSVPVFDEVVISTSLMSNIESVDELSGVVVCQAGCVLETIDQHLEQFGFMMPLDLGAKGSCHIGGNVATNAGGLRLLRYGSLQGSVLGLEAVTADGTVLDCMSSLRKDNTGYHIKNLLIGSEGTLGIITKVAILCPVRPQAISLALLSLDSFSTALATACRAKSMLGEILSSCEFIDASSMECVTKNLNLVCPVAAANCYLLLETSGSNGEHDQAKLEAFLERSMEESGVQDGTLASEPSRMSKIWQLRERLAEALLLEGYVFKQDISLPLTEYYALVEKTRLHLGNKVSRCCGYGHLGDGNLHLNITVPHYSHEVARMLEPWLWEQVAACRGSISAEHGLGFKKRNDIHFSKAASAVALMQQIKKLMDPKAILNPYKCIPDIY